MTQDDYALVERGVRALEALVGLAERAQAGDEAYAAQIAQVQRAREESDKAWAEAERLRAENQTAYAIAGWHECRLAIVRRDGWAALNEWEQENPIPGKGAS